MYVIIIDLREGTPLELDSHWHAWNLKLIDTILDKVWYTSAFRNILQEIDNYFSSILVVYGVLRTIGKIKPRSLSDY